MSEAAGGALAVLKAGAVPSSAPGSETRLSEVESAGAADAPGTSHTRSAPAPTAAAAAAQPAECASLWRGAGRARARACCPAGRRLRACVRARARRGQRL